MPQSGHRGRRPDIVSRTMGALLAKSVLGDDEEPELIGAFLGPAPGTLGEVGANDPVQLSQTHHLERLGWDGILIEPLREYAERLRSKRRARVFESGPGAPETGGGGPPLSGAG